MRTIWLLLPALSLLLWAIPSLAQEEGQSPSDQLKKEHEVTMVVAEAAAGEADTIRRTGSVDADRVQKMLTFFQNFTDACHHAKEERFYFPAALVYDAEGMEGPIREVEVEHEQFRAMLQEVDFLLSKQAETQPSLVAERLERYAAMLREHIAKENELIFSRVDLYLPPAEEAAMLEGFRRIETVELGEGFHEKYHRMAKEIAGKK